MISRPEASTPTTDRSAVSSTCAKGSERLLPKNTGAGGCSEANPHEGNSGGDNNDKSVGSEDKGHHGEGIWNGAQSENDEHSVQGNKSGRSSVGSYVDDIGHAKGFERGDEGKRGRFEQFCGAEEDGAGISELNSRRDEPVLTEKGLHEGNINSDDTEDEGAGHNDDASDKGDEDEDDAYKEDGELTSEEDIPLQDTHTIRRVANSTKKPRTKADREARKGLKVGPPGRWTKEQAAFLRSMKPDFDTIDRVSRGKLKRFEDFWTKCTNVFWQKWSWEDVKDQCKGDTSQEVIGEIKAVSLNTHFDCYIGSPGCIQGSQKLLQQ
jgi:hypothetical protein